MNPLEGILPKGIGTEGTCLHRDFAKIHDGVKERFKHATQVFGVKCFYCDAKATTTDHLIPRHLGGSHQQKNLVPACYACNQEKGNRLPTNNEMAKHREGWRVFSQKS